MHFPIKIKKDRFIPPILLPFSTKTLSYCFIFPLFLHQNMFETSRNMGQKKQVQVRAYLLEHFNNFCSLSILTSLNPRMQRIVKPIRLYEALHYHLQRDKHSLSLSKREIPNIVERRSKKEKLS